VPNGNRITAGILRPVGDTSPDLGPSRGLEPRSARYRRAALQLSYDGVSDRIGHDPNTPAGTHCSAGRHGNLAVCTVLVDLAER
jgi:hypothetical protein